MGIEDGLFCFFRPDVVPSEVIAIGVIPIEFWLVAARSLSLSAGRSQARPTIPKAPSLTLKHALPDNSNEKSLLLVGRGEEGGREADEARALAEAAQFEEHKLALPLCSRLAQSTLVISHFVLPDEAPSPRRERGSIRCGGCDRGLRTVLAHEWASKRIHPFPPPDTARHIPAWRAPSRREREDAFP